MSGLSIIGIVVGIILTIILMVIYDENDSYKKTKAVKRYIPPKPVEKEYPTLAELNLKPNTYGLTNTHFTLMFKDGDYTPKLDDRFVLFGWGSMSHGIIKFEGGGIDGFLIHCSVKTYIDDTTFYKPTLTSKATGKQYRIVLDTHNMTMRLLETKYIAGTEYGNIYTLRDIIEQTMKKCNKQT